MADGYAILRMVKHKSLTSVRAMSVHALREKPVPNAIPGAPKPLSGGAKTTKELLTKLQAGIALARKEGGRQGFTKASSPCLEFLVTSGHEKMLSMTMEEQNQYFKNSLKFLAEDFGGQENILSWSVHRDEHTPHMQVFVMPLDRTTNRFSAAKMIGGPAGMGQRLDRFAKEVGSRFGMKRGEKGSTAAHIPIREFYKALSTGAEVPKLIEVPDMPTATDRLKPGYADKLQAHEEAKKKRKKQEEELLKQASLAKKMSPKMVERQAERYREAKQLEQHMKTQEEEIQKMRDAAAADKKDAVSARDRARELEIETRLLAQSADKVFMNSDGAKALDQMSRVMDPKIIERLSQSLNIKLVPGRGLLDQLRKAGIGSTMIESAKFLTAKLEMLIEKPEMLIEKPSQRPVFRPKA